MKEYERKEWSGQEEEIRIKREGDGGEEREGRRRRKRKEEG